MQPRKYLSLAIVRYADDTGLQAFCRGPCTKCLAARGMLGRLAFRELAQGDWALPRRKPAAQLQQVNWEVCNFVTLTDKGSGTSRDFMLSLWCRERTCTSSRPLSLALVRLQPNRSGHFIRSTDAAFKKPRCSRMRLQTSPRVITSGAGAEPKTGSIIKSGGGGGAARAGRR